MRISDWSSDVCSSDLLPGMLGPLFPGRLVVGEGTEPLLVAADGLDEVSVLILAANHKVLNHQSHASQPGKASVTSRSEEHTSELQSLMRISYAVFCLKKKKHK